MIRIDSRCASSSAGLLSSQKSLLGRRRGKRRRQRAAAAGQLPRTRTAPSPRPESPAPRPPSGCAQAWARMRALPPAPGSGTAKRTQSRGHPAGRRLRPPHAPGPPFQDTRRALLRRISNAPCSAGSSSPPSAIRRGLRKWRWRGALGFGFFGRASASRAPGPDGMGAALSTCGDEPLPGSTPPPPPGAAHSHYSLPEVRARSRAAPAVPPPAVASRDITPTARGFGESAPLSPRGVLSTLALSNACRGPRHAVGDVPRICRVWRSI